MGRRAFERSRVVMESAPRFSLSGWRSTSLGSYEVRLGKQVHEYEAKIEALERKIGQLTMELEVEQKTLSHRVAETDAPPSIISGPGVFPSRKNVGS